MKLQDIISDFIYAKDLIPIQSSSSTDSHMHIADTLSLIPAAGNASFLLKKDSQNMQTAKTSASALTAIQEAQNAACGKSVTGAKKVSGRLNKRIFRELVNERRAAALHDVHLPSDSLVHAHQKKLADQEWADSIHDDSFHPETGLIHRIPLMYRVNKIFNPITEETKLIISAPVNNIISKRIFIRLGHDKLENSKGLCGAPGEKEIIDAIGPLLGEKLIEYGHTVMVYRSKSGTFKSYGDANMAGVEEAYAFHADLFISCHANSNDNKSARGTEVLYNSLPISKTYAEIIQAAMLKELNTYNRKIKPSTLLEMRETVKKEIPAVILEPIHFTHPYDLEQFNKCQADPKNEGGLGTVIAKCVHNFLQKQNP